MPSFKTHANQEQRSRERLDKQDLPPRRLPVEEIPADYDEFLAQRREKERRAAAAIGDGWRGHDGVSYVSFHSQRAYEVLVVNGHPVKFRAIADREKPKKKGRPREEDES